MKLQTSITRLTVGLVAAALAFACSAILDTDELKSNAKLDGSETVDGPQPSDAVGIDDSGLTDTKPDPDRGVCVDGKTCTVPGQQGLCAKGKIVCQGTTGICQQQYQPTPEKCVESPAYDTDCDGLADTADPDAHKSCGPGNYCAGTKCAKGCWDNSQCKTLTTDRCSNHVCRCGTHSACSQPNPLCIATNCRCDADSRCGPQETCKSGVCYCGSTAGQATGPACAAEDCDPTTGTCGGPPPDSGPPDQGVPDTVSPPDQGVPDQATPDQATPDLVPAVDS